MTFTSQSGEDKWLAENWPTLGLPDRGFFVEFGAANGVTFSNTFWLEKSKGWHGLLCEPDPRHVITDRPNSIVERVAVGPAGTISLALTADPYLSGSLRHGDAKEPCMAVLERIDVETVPLTTLLDKHQVERVDFISVDTEGTEIAAWRTLDLARWRPKVAIVELWTWGLADRTNDVIEMMLFSGYAMRSKTDYNGIFVDLK